MNYILKKPIEFDGEKVTELNFDFENLSYPDLTKCERETNIRLGNKGISGLIEMNTTYILCVAAKAAGAIAELLFNLKIKDITSIKNITQKFLMSDKSEIDEETGKYILINPIIYENKKIEEITFDFDNLEFGDMQRCENEINRKLKKEKKILVRPELNTEYVISIATKAAELPIELLESLRADDITIIKLFTQNFLMDVDLEEDN